MGQRTLPLSLVFRTLLILGLGGLIFSFSECGGGMQTIGAPIAPAMVQGRVHGGQPAVAGASIQLYAVNTTTYGGPSTPLLGTPATTNQYGGFSFTNPTCPGGDPQIYLVSTGGHTGTPNNNPAITMMAAFGNCSDLQPTSFIDIDEVSTVAAVYALNPFMSTGGGQNIGASTTNAQGLINAFATATNLLADTSQGHGTSPGPNVPSGATVPSAVINTLAGIISNCINSDPTMSSECTNLFADTTSATITPSNTIDALLSIARYPGNNTAAIAGHLPLTPPFIPVETFSPGTGPPDWTMAITYTGGPLNSPQALAVDGSGNVWIANTAGSTAVEYSPIGELLGSYDPGSVLNFPWGIAIDTSGNAWLADTGNNDIVGLDPSGNQVGSALTGGGLNFDVAIAISGTNDLWALNDDGGPGHRGSLSLFTSGLPVSPAPFGFWDVELTVSTPSALAVDSSGNAWTTDYNEWSITKLDSMGNDIDDEDADDPLAIAMGAGGTVWIYDQDNQVTVYTVGDNTQIGAQIAGSPFSGGGLNASNHGGIAVDGAGNAWISNYNGNSLSEFGTSGALSPPFSAPNSTALGYGTAAGLSDPWGIAIDGSGNIWVANNAGGNNTVTEFVGLAAPAVTPLATAAANNTFGTLP
jgi:streptogramin lyase